MGNPIEFIDINGHFGFKLKIGDDGSPSSVGNPSGGGDIFLIVLNYVIENGSSIKDAFNITSFLAKYYCQLVPNVN